jgi:hypothetical protein
MSGNSLRQDQKTQGEPEGDALSAWDIDAKAAS